MCVVYTLKMGAARRGEIKNTRLKFEFSMVDKNTGRFVKHHPGCIYLFTHTRVNSIFQKSEALASKHQIIMRQILKVLTSLKKFKLGSHNALIANSLQ